MKKNKYFKRNTSLRNVRRSVRDNNFSSIETINIDDISFLNYNNYRVANFSLRIEQRKRTCNTTNLASTQHFRTML